VVTSVSTYQDGWFRNEKVVVAATSSLLASAASNVSLQNTIYDSVRPPEDEMLGVYLSRWQSIPGAVLPTKQSLWDFPSITQADSKWKSQNPTLLRRHSIMWVELDYEAVRVVVALRLGLNIGHLTPAAAERLLTLSAKHSLICKQAPSRIAKHQHLNDLVTRALVSAGVPATNEPIGLIRRDGKRLDGMTQMPWRSGKLLVWDVTVVSTTAESYIAAAARGRGEVAEMAATRKCQKYSELSMAYLFLPIAVETLGPMNDSAYEFFEILSREITDMSGDSREVSFLSKDCQSLYRGSTRPCFVTRSLCTTIGTSSHSNCFYQFCFY